MPQPDTSIFQGTLPALMTPCTPARTPDFDALVRSGRFPVIHTELAAASPFWRAEDYHQDYYKKNPLRYKYYKYGCGRANRLEALWGKP